MTTLEWSYQALMSTPREQVHLNQLVKRGIEEYRVERQAIQQAQNKKR